MAETPEQPFSFARLTDEEARANILDVLYRASPEEYNQGLSWYQKAGEEVSRLPARFAWKRGITRNTRWDQCRVVAHLSPGCSWEKNIALAKRFIETGDCPHPYGRAVVDRCRSEYGPSGPKTRAFFYNLYDPEAEVWPDCVTIDRHAGAACAGRALTEPELKTLTPKQYSRMERQYKVLAEILGLRPNQLQAIVWLVWRREKGLKGGIPNVQPDLGS